MRCPACGNSANDVAATVCRVCGSTLPAHGIRSTARTSRQYKDLTELKRHVLARVGAPNIELKVDVEMRFGRSREVDVIIQSPRVSRVHALVFWQAGAPHIRDLASQNGVFVNGAQIREAKLEDGDEVTIGPLTCTYRKLDAINSLGELQELLDSSEATQEMEAIAMSGRLAEVTLYEVLETLGYNARTGTVEVFGPWGDEGRIGLKDGGATWAELGDLTGRAAVEALLEWTEGHFRFTSVDDARPSNIDLPLQKILEDARKRSEHGLTAKDYGSEPPTLPATVKRPPKEEPAKRTDPATTPLKRPDTAAMKRVDPATAPLKRPGKTDEPPTVPAPVKRPPKSGGDDPPTVVDPIKRRP
jgi:hypothetical protein